MWHGLHRQKKCLGTVGLKHGTKDRSQVSVSQMEDEETESNNKLNRIEKN